ncbi:WAT1-related protein At1g43650-like [Glycine soja]|uniref:WAT1-related protein At1g43650-like n=1 Tax=Glycine soja TaxID=3848 RepID=UPI00103A06F2|nr:WAT1-related protein At1g43650-like [Glycine soja]
MKDDADEERQFLGGEWWIVIREWAGIKMYEKHERSTVGLLGKVFSFRIVSTPHREPNNVAETVFVYAGMALLSKAAISKEMSPYVFVVYRQAFASVALSPFAFFDSKQSAPLSCNLLCKLLCKLFLVSLVGLTASSNLYYVSINYTTATFAAAATNTVPAITFIMAVLIRMESISVKRVHGLAKILGSVLSLAGAITFALVKGPHLGFMKCYPEN